MLEQHLEGLVVGKGHSLHQVLEYLDLGVVLRQTDGLHKVVIHVIWNQGLGQGAEVLLQNRGDRADVLVQARVHQVGVHTGVVSLDQLTSFSGHTGSTVDTLDLQTTLVHSFDTLLDDQRHASLLQFDLIQQAVTKHDLFCGRCWGRTMGTSSAGGDIAETV